MFELLLWALTATTTATATTSDEDVIIIVDEPAETEAPTTNVWGVQARTSMRFDTRIAVDTSFDRKSEHVGELWLGAKLVLDVDLGGGVSAYAGPNFNYAAALDREGGDRQFLYLVTPEAYVSYASGPFVVSAGAMVFSWGPSDIVGPNDQLNPIDYRRSILGFAEDAKIPVLAAEGVATFGPLSLRAVVQPFFTASRFHLTAWDFSALQAGVFPLSADFPAEEFFSESQIDELGDQILATERPDQRPDNATVAGRLTFTLDPVDLSLNVFHGWDTLPSIIIDDDLVFLANRFSESYAAGEPFAFTDEDVLSAVERVRDAVDGGRKIIKGTYLRRTVFGFDAVAALDPFVVKVDVAYSLKHTVYTQALRPKAHPWLNAVVGLEYLYGDALQVLVEAFAVTIFDVPSDYRLIFFEPVSEPATAERTVFFPGVAAAVRYAILDGDLQFEIGGTYTIGGDLVVLPDIQWKLDDTHRFTLGGMLVEGRRGSYGQRYTNTDQVYVAYRWTY